MRKLFIFLISFIVPIYAHALDESLSTEYFSLIKNPSLNNSGFLNIKVSYPSSCLFLNENKRRSKEYQAFQKLWLHQYSERTPLARIATVEDGKQNWRDMCSHIYGQQENISSTEVYLKRNAERAKKRRITRGWLSLLAGGALMVFGASVTFEEPRSYLDPSPIFDRPIKPILIITGAGVLGAGIIFLAVPSRTEKDYKNYLRERNRKQRNELGLCVGIGPYGGVKIGFAFSF